MSKNYHIASNYLKVIEKFTIYSLDVRKFNGRPYGKYLPLLSAKVVNFLKVQKVLTSVLGQVSY
jgi:hypothetical protein